jgi:hypothetical protein
MFCRQMPLSLLFGAKLGLAQLIADGNNHRRKQLNANEDDNDDDDDRDDVVTNARDDDDSNAALYDDGEAVRVASDHLQLGRNVCGRR